MTDRTRHLLDAAAFAAMKPGAILVNMARGKMVDENALVDALRPRGIRHINMPATPQAIWSALQEAGTAGGRA